MGLEQLNPVFLKMHVNQQEPAEMRPFVFDKRTVCHYELDYISSSTGRMILDGKEHLLKAHDLFFRKPGQTVQGFMPYRFHYILFDLEGADDELLNYLNHLPDKLNFQKSTALRARFDEILALSLGGSLEASLLIKAKLLEIIYEFQKRSNPSFYNKHITKAIRYMEENFAQNIKVKEIAEHLHISESSLFHQFREQMNLTPVAYLTRIRILKGQYYLLNTNQSVAQIGTRCGFGSISYFSYVFQKQTGLSPTAFRNQYLLEHHLS